MKRRPRGRGGYTRLAIRLFLQQCQGECTAECLASAHISPAYTQALVCTSTGGHLWSTGDFDNSNIAMTDVIREERSLVLTSFLDSRYLGIIRGKVDSIELLGSPSKVEVSAWRSISKALTLDIRSRNQHPRRQERSSGDPRKGNRVGERKGVHYIYARARLTRLRLSVH